MILTPEELAELTGRKRSSAQMAVLRFMGIEHRQRPDGSVVVLRAHVDAVLGLEVASTKTKERELDLSAIK